MQFYDKDAILEDADALEVAEYIGMDVTRKGSKHYILCPGHEKRLGKPDYNIGSCILTKKGYRCFACVQTVDIIQMVMEYTGEPFQEALGLVADACGGRERYLLKGDALVRKAEKMPLSKEDLEAIGLFSGNQQKTKVIACAGDMLLDEYPQYQKDTYFDKDDVAHEYYLFFKSVQNNSITNLFRDDKLMFYGLICQKSAEAMFKHKILLDSFLDRNAVGFCSLLNLIKGPDGYMNDIELYHLREAIKEQYSNAKRILEEYIVHLPLEERSQYLNVTNQLI